MTEGRDLLSAHQVLNPAQFVERWAGRKLTERASAQPHFTDLCRMLGVAAPTDIREHDSTYGFEARTDISASGVYATVIEDGLPYYHITTSGTGTGHGFADVWKRKYFAWEYKRPGKHASLDDALLQLRIYSPSLGHPPLLIVCDIDRFEIHTNFPNYPVESYKFDIAELAQPSKEWKEVHPDISPLEALRKVFTDPEWFKPDKSRDTITAELAKKIGDVAIALRKSGNDPHAVAHFLMQIVFCFFAEDVGLLPNKLFKKLVEHAHNSGKIDEFPKKARMLFKAMERGGDYGNDNIQHFNGGLFRNVENDPVIKIDLSHLGTLLVAANADWNSVDPTILGTLFERSLDPDKRSQIGAHYTSREDILLIVEPVVMQPLRRKWVDVQKDIAEWLEQRQAQGVTERRKKELSKKIDKSIIDFVDHLGTIRVLDPACGSGNFLFVTIQQLLDLENEVRGFAARPEMAVTFTPRVKPQQLMGIEVNDYACELARVSIWIGYLQWLHANSTSQKSPPILDPLDTIEHRDAILKWADKNGQPINVWQKGAQCLGAADWPEADFIVGNPPFLGNKLFRKSGLTDSYIGAMYETFDLPHSCDLCCYWFELAARAYSSNPKLRVGLLATAAIRAGSNRTVLDRIKESGNIFMAWSDRRWVLNGAAVRVSMIGFDSGLEASRTLDGRAVSTIHADLTSLADFTALTQLAENVGIAFQGPVKVGSFDTSFEVAHQLLARPNPVALSNLNVMKLWMNATDITKRARGLWIVDFEDMPVEEASLYEAPMEHVERHVRAFRARNNDRQRREQWWRLGRSAGELRKARRKVSRVVITPRVASFRSFVWADCRLIPDSRLFLFAREDEYFLGVLQSSVHELWTLATCSWHGVGNDPTYNTTTCFETFPLPWPPGTEPVKNEHYKAIAAAAKELNSLRENWLNPPELLADVERKMDLNEDFSDIRDEEARTLLRHSALMAYAAKDPKLKLRTLTNLYNQRPSWLKLAHRKLDEAVIAAYAGVDPAGKWDCAWAEAYEPFGAGEITIDKKGKKKDSPEVIAAKQAAIEHRKAVDEKILANLLRLNQLRAQ